MVDSVLETQNYNAKMLTSFSNTTLPLGAPLSLSFHRRHSVLCRLLLETQATVKREAKNGTVPAYTTVQLLHTWDNATMENGRGNAVPGRHN